MPVIKVIHGFAMRLNSSTPKRTFKAGQRYKLTREEMNHWFVQGCIAEGRAIEVPEKPDTDKPETDKPEPEKSETEQQEAAEASQDAEQDGEDEELFVPTLAELMALKADELKELAAECLLALPDRATKEQIATALIAAVTDDEKPLCVVKTASGFAIAGK